MYRINRMVGARCSEKKIKRTVFAMKLSAGQRASMPNHGNGRCVDARREDVHLPPQRSSMGCAVEEPPEFAKSAPPY